MDVIPFLVVVESVFNLPADAKLVQIGAMLWPLEESVRFKSEAVKLDDKKLRLKVTEWNYDLM